MSALQQLLSSASEGGGPPELVRAAAAALRQLANSDGVKAQLAEEGVLPVLLRYARTCSDLQYGIRTRQLPNDSGHVTVCMHAGGGVGARGKSACLQG